MAPLWIVVAAVVSSLVLLGHKASNGVRAQRPDLLLATFAPQHAEAYKRILPAFERQHGVRVDVQVLNWQALKGRLQNAMMAGTDVPDLVELSDDAMGFFTNGALEDVGFLDLTAQVRQEKLDQEIVPARFSLWSSRGHIFALPHDVHPVMLAYRKDVFDAQGVDVGAIATWDDFAEVGRKLTQDRDGDGVIDQYALDLPTGAHGLRLLLAQRGAQLFDERGQVAYDSAETADVIAWYVRAIEGPQRFGYSAGWGQPVVQALTDGLVLSTFVADWRAFLLAQEAPHLAGKMGLMPLPAWQQGERRTSTWGGTGLAITKRTAKPDLAWALAKHLYLARDQVGERYNETGIIPPWRSAWDAPALAEPNPFYGGQPVGKLFADLAPQAPATYSAAAQALVAVRLDQVFLSALAAHQQGKAGDDLRTTIANELRASAEAVRKLLGRNVFVARGEP